MDDIIQNQTVNIHKFNGNLLCTVIAELICKVVKISYIIGKYYVFHGRVTLFFANNFLTQRWITMKFLHNFF